MEFMYNHNNPEVHFGPDTPIGGPYPEEWMNNMTDIKLVLFTSGVIVQIIMYILLWRGHLEMPCEFNEDVITLNEVRLLCGKRGGSVSDSSSNSNNNNFGLALTSDDYEDNHNRYFSDPVPLTPFTIAYVENFYILFWILKDMFWSWGTGDMLGKDPKEPIVAMCEALALSFGALALINTIITTYIT